MDETEEDRTWLIWLALSRKELAEELELEEEDDVIWHWWLGSNSDWDVSSEQVEEAEAEADEVMLGEAIKIENK